jgi:hypothetical protein
VHTHAYLHLLQLLQAHKDAYQGLLCVALLVVGLLCLFWVFNKKVRAELWL